MEQGDPEDDAEISDFGFDIEYGEDDAEIST